MRVEGVIDNLRMYRETRGFNRELDMFANPILDHLNELDKF